MLYYNISIVQTEVMGAIGFAALVANGSIALMPYRSQFTLCEAKNRAFD